LFGLVLCFYCSVEFGPSLIEFLLHFFHLPALFWC
jgi:hypothetical protein